MDKTLTRNLEQASETLLVDIIKSVYGINNEVDNRIEVALLAPEPEKLIKQLTSRIDDIRLDDGFISYFSAYGFSTELDNLVDDIAGLVEVSPEQAFHLIDDLIDTHEEVQNRADDSGGDIGTSYVRAVDIWLQAALLWQKSGHCTLNWPEELKQRHYNNDYAVWDELIAGSYTLLGEASLRILAEEFEAEYLKLSASQSDGCKYRASSARLGIQAVAEALGDIELYEHSVLIAYSEPNNRQQEAIAEFCLKQKNATAALTWLKAYEDCSLFGNRATELLVKAYQLSGQKDKLLALRQKEYDQYPDFSNLQALLDVLPEQEQVTARQAAAENALNIADISSRIDTLLELDATRLAAEQLMNHNFESETVFYGHLQSWATLFDQAGYSLVVVICYRLLLSDILNAGRSKAYDYAADYYRHLERLDEKIENYQSLTDWSEFKDQLEQKHGRKYSFWNRL